MEGTGPAGVAGTPAERGRGRMMHGALRPLGDIKQLRDPVLLAGFTGFTDATGSAVSTIGYLAEQWGAEALADIDPEPFYDFTVQRPRVRLEEGERVIDWPENRFMVASPKGADHDMLLLIGAEPHLRWRTFTGVVESLLREVGCTTSITLGAQPAGVPHTRPLPVSLSASHPEFEQQFSLKAPASRYQGQTGIVGVLNLHLRSLGWRNASLWAMAPHYLTIGPNPNVGTSLVRLVDHGFGTSTSLTGLEEQAQQFDEQVAEVMRESSDAAAYVRQLEEQYDANQPPLPAISEPGAPGGLPPTADLLDDLERFLREQRDSD
ncbi:MAG: PAC2 family protein [Dehalococcoidia bacterium]|nr:PAC2 family protein [Dehalococcoidia bacterium]